MDRLHASAEELLAFAFEGEPLRAAAQQHFDTCLLCQQQMFSYQKKISSLISWLYRTCCPSATALSYYCLPDVLPDFERRQIAEHIVRCPLCTREVADSRKFLEVS